MNLTNEIINQTFKSSVPIRDRNNFVGRVELLKFIDRSISAPGRQTIVFGERGVGKTSFVNVGLSQTESIKDYSIYEYNCSKDDTYHDIIGSILRKNDQLLTTTESKLSSSHSVDGKLKIVVAEGGGKQEERKEETKKYLIPASFTPNEIVSNFLMEKNLIFIDEYDRIESSKTKMMFAETLKILSNYHSDTKFVITGVSNSAKSLIGYHLSTLRNLGVISIPKMSDEEVLEIIKKGIEKLELEFSDNLIKLILLASCGLPFFAHLICEQLSYIALDKSKKNLDENDFFDALNSILLNLPEHIKASFELACSTQPTVYQIEQDINTPLFNMLIHPPSVRKEALCIFSLVEDCNLERAKELFGYYIELGKVFEPDKYKDIDELLFYNILTEIARISDILRDYDTHILFNDSYYRGCALLEAANFLGKEIFLKLIDSL